MRPVWTALLCGGCFVGVAQPLVRTATAKEWHVAAQVDRPGDGSLQAPFASLLEARDAVRDDGGHQLGEPTTIIVHGGMYPQPDPLELGPADSGTAEQPVRWTAAPGERVQLVSAGAQTLLAIYDAQFLRIDGWEFGVAPAQAIELAHCEQVQVSHCLIQGSGHTGIHVFGGRHCTIEHCRIENCAQLGLRVEAGSRQTLVSCGHEVRDCQLSDCGTSEQHWSAALYVAGVGTLAQDNLIQDCSNTGIRLEGNNHVVRGNRLQRICLHSRDNGAIYLGQDWTERGNLIEENWIVQVGDTRRDDLMAIYLDDFASGNVVRKNVISSAGRGIAIGGGEHNRIEQNAIENCLVGIQLDDRGSHWLAAANEPGGFAHQGVADVSQVWGVYRELYPELAERPSDVQLRAQHNQLFGNLLQHSGPLAFDAQATSQLNRFADNLVGSDIFVLSDEAGKIRFTSR